jgi:hypothetical protein
MTDSLLRWVSQNQAVLAALITGVATVLAALIGKSNRLQRRKRRG